MMKTQAISRVMAAIAFMLAVSFNVDAQFSRDRLIPLDSLVEKTSDLDKSKSISNAIKFFGAGTSNNPYKISNAEDLKKLAELVNSNTEPYSKASAYYEQTANINLSGVQYTPIGSHTRPFKGKYNGANFTISNLTINDNNLTTGLFGGIDRNALVRNIRMTTVFISGDARSVGGLAGVNYGTIQYCCISELRLTGNETTYGAGGIAGTNMGFIMNCIVRASSKVMGNYNVGGIAGANEGTIENCYSEAWVEAKNGRNGGIVGINDNGLVQYCYHTGHVCASISTSVFPDNKSGSGGIAGCGGRVKNCVALSVVVLIVAKIYGLGRVYGITSTGANNYARSDMGLRNGNGNVPLTIGPSMKDGATITASNYNSSNWWKSIGFSDEHWSFANNRLPHLNDFPGLTQNPKVMLVSN